MKDLKRNLIYWGWTLEKMVLIVLGVVLVMWGILTFLQGTSFAEEAIRELGTYLIMGGFIISFTDAINGANTFFPFTISMGSTRKASFIAMQTMQHLMMFEYVILAGGICYFTMRDVFGIFVQYLFTIFGAILLWQAFLNFTALLCARFGNGVGVMAYILFIVVCVGLASYGFLSGTFENGEFETVLKDFIRKPYLLGIGAVLDVTATKIYFEFIKKKDLRI